MWTSGLRCHPPPPGTRHPPRVDSCFNFNNVRIGPFTTQPHALHLLANLVHVQSEPQLLRSDGNCHTQSLLGARVATSRSTRNAAVGPRTSRIFRVVTQPTFGMGLSALSASVSARQALGIGHNRATIESRAGGTETQSPRRMCASHRTRGNSRMSPYSPAAGLTHPRPNGWLVPWVACWPIGASPGCSGAADHGELRRWADAGADKPAGR